MNGQQAHRIARTLDRVPTIPRATPAPAPRSGSLLKTGWAAVLGLGWPISFAVALALEPAPAQPEAAPSLVIELVGLALFAALVSTAMAAAVRHRVAAAAGVVVGLIAVTSAVMCPVSGHHAVGPWWYAELGLMATMLATSLVGLGHRARAAA